MRLIDMTARTMQGLEEVLAEELRELGAQDIVILKRAVSFKGSKKLLYEANLWCRTALRILIPIETFFARGDNELYKHVKRIKWEDYIGLNDTFAVDAYAHSSVFTHSKFASLRVKDAIVDQFKDKYDDRPDVDVNDPTLRIHLHIAEKKCIISIDASGYSLNKRGYRTLSKEAPINEVLAAGLVKLSQWDGVSSFSDPMCGSGTILIEAARFACGLPPHVKTDRFGFLRWKNFDQGLWDMVLEEAETKKIEIKNLLHGTDLNASAITAAAKNIGAAGMRAHIKLNIGRMEASEGAEEGGILITNPPYGERMQPERIDEMYKTFGDTIKTNYTGYSAWLITSNLTALKRVGLKPSRKIPLFNGALECRFAKFEVYSGSKRTAKETSTNDAAATEADDQ